MKLHLRISFLIVIMAGIYSSASAQRDLTIHFMNKINQSNYSNPAFIPENNFSIGLPVLSSLTFDLSHSGFKFRDIIRKTADDSNRVDMDNVINNILQDKNYLSTEFTTDVINVKFKVKGVYLGLNVTEKISMRFDYPKDLIDLAWNGNAGFADRNESAEMGMNLDVMHYREYALSGALKIKKFTAGARLKMLAGMANVTTERSNVTFTTDPTEYTHTIKSDFLINTSLPDFDSLDAQYGMNMNNLGFGADLGGTFELNEKFSFAASVVDFGYINWKTNVKNYKNDNVSYKFEGMTYEQMTNKDELKKFTDTLKSKFDVKETKDSYSTSLTPKVYLSGSFKLTKNDKFGVLFYSEYYHKLHPALTLAYNRNVGKWFTGGLTYSMFNGDFFNIGLGTGFKLGPVQIYTVQDNILGAFLPTSTNNYNLRFGINLVFGKPKEAAAKQPAPPAPAPESNPVPTEKKEEEKKKEEEPEKKKEIKNENE